MPLLDPRTFGQQQPGLGLLAQYGGMAPGAQAQPAFNPNTLLALGAGIAGGRDWGEGLSKGFGGALQVRQADQQRREKYGDRNATFQALLQRGMDPQQAWLMANSPQTAQMLALEQQREQQQSNADRSFGLQERQFDLSQQNALKPKVIMVDDAFGFKKPMLFDPATESLTPLQGGQPATEQQPQTAPQPGQAPSVGQFSGSGATQPQAQPQQPALQIPPPPPGAHGPTWVKKFTESAAEKAGGQSEGKAALSENLEGMVQTYLKLDDLGGIVNPDKGAIANLRARTDASGLGQTVGGALGSETQSIRERINNIQPLLIQSIRQATGLSARAMDSNRELQFYLQAATDATKDIYSNLAAIDVLDRTYGLGTVLKNALPPDVYKRVKQQSDVSARQGPVGLPKDQSKVPSGNYIYDPASNRLVPSR